MSSNNLKFMLGTTAAVFLGGLAQYEVTSYFDRKRAKVREQQQKVRTACASNAKGRLHQMSKSGAAFSDIRDARAEEDAFLDIVRIELSGFSRDIYKGYNETTTEEK